MRVFYVAVLGCVLVGCNGGDPDPDGMGGAGAMGGAGGTGGANGNPGAGGNPDATVCGSASDYSDCDRRRDAVNQAAKKFGATACKVQTYCDDRDCFLVTEDRDGDGFRASCEGVVDLPFRFRDSAPSDAPSKAGRHDCDDSLKHKNPDSKDAARLGYPNEGNCAFFEDNDCDGELTCDCEPNEDNPVTIPCYYDEQGREIQRLARFFDDDPEAFANEEDPPGACQWGHRECVGDGKWGACLSAVGDRKEACHYDGGGDAPTSGDGNDDYDCDGNLAQDEALADSTESTILGLTSFYCDADNDGWLASDAQIVKACDDPPTSDCGDGSQPVEWRTDPAQSTFKDCNDEDDRIHPKAGEDCDGKDNDCNDKVDDEPLLPEGDLSVASYQCGEGGPWIPQCNVAFLDCSSKDLICETPQSLTHCGACDNACTFSCAASDSQFACDEVASFAVGEVHACALTQNGQLSCWGRGKEGELGSEIDKDSSGQPLPVLFPSNVGDANRTVISVAVGAPAGATGSHTCAVTAPNGEVYCWGSGTYGQNGDGLGGPRKQPTTTVFLDSPGVSLALGSDHSCVVTEANSLLCWGANEDGQLGIGGKDPVPAPNAAHRIRPSAIGAFYAEPTVELVHHPIDNAIQASAYYTHTCFVTSLGAVFCAGDNSDGQLGNQVGNTPSAFRHIGYFDQVQGLPEKAVEVQTGRTHTCARLESGRVACWGANGEGQLGIGAPGANNATPSLVVGPGTDEYLTGVSALSLAYNVSCALAVGKVYCWGVNSGEFGDTNPPLQQPATLRPWLNPHLSGVTSFGLRATFGCALTESQPGLQCWGTNYLAQLGRGGLGDSEVQITPSPIAPLPLQD